MKSWSLLVASVILSCTTTPLQAQQPHPGQPAALAAEQNPLLEWGGEYPRWSRMTPQQCVADIRLALERARQRIDSICAVQPADATWDNTFGAFETMSDELGVADQLMTNLVFLMDSPELRRAQEEVTPLLAEFDSSITSNGPLWKVIRQASTAPWVRSLSAARQRYIQQVVDSFKDSGADLPAHLQARKAEIEKELARLYIQFDKNCKDSIDAWQLVISDKSRLAGMSEDWLSRAAAKALEKGFGTPEQPQWLITLDFASVADVLRHCDVEETRRLCWEGRNTEGNTPEFDNAPVVARVMELRAELATLLGFGTYADLATARRMVGSGDAALAFVDGMMHKIKPYFDREVNALLDFIAHRTGRPTTQLHPWDAMYFLTQMREEVCRFDSDALRPYHKKENVVAGMFSIFESLYAIRIAELPTVCLQPGQELPAGTHEVWHPEVKLYAVYDAASGQHLGSLYMDLHPRSTKRDGAWVMRLRLCPTVNGTHQPHLVSLVCNLKSPTADKPALFTHLDVLTLFHEFGHALHGVLSETELGAHAGTSVARDFVELPSQLNENWVWIPEGITAYARHWQTDEPLPADMLRKLQQSRNFMPAIDAMNQLRMAKLDLEMHMNYATKFRGRDLDSATQNLMEPWQLPLSTWAPSVMRCLTHCVSSGYAAGYYSYKWAEVLAADAFTRFEKEGPTNTATGADFRRAVLSTGGSRPETESFRDFMGRDPNPDALLQQQGLCH
ncbi:MAG: M3 family metallopeptidase [Akkermansia sp.]|nr:M3 family metallopeptidase [Akkermansia sp.]